MMISATSTFSRFFCASLLLLLLIASAAAEILDLSWEVTDYSPRTLNVGDIVNFRYTIAHNVYIHPTNDCTEQGSILVGDNDDSPAQYQITADDAGKLITFACDTARHCENGQIINITVVDPSAPPPTNETDTETSGADPIASPFWGFTVFATATTTTMMMTMLV
mmetsp:Transcript_12716/g.35263  ORF Transcript_12716/g.35263 Transcript_12716/m.35263 type:complete len:165 (+) Transcript_12716:58-552(+)